ncbi:Calx-beta domain protein [compost metagenome]
MARYAVFNIVFAQASTQVMSVDYTTVPNTATEGEDFTPTTGTVTFQPGETLKQVRVPIRTTEESLEEAFQLQLSNPVNCVLGREQGTAVIPAGGENELEALFPNRNLGVLFYQGEKHPGDGGGASDTEWTLAPLDATQDDPPGTPSANPFPGYMGEFNFNAGPLWVRTAEGPIQLANGFFLHYLVVNQSPGSTITQILFTDTDTIPPDQKLLPENQEAFNTWWDSMTGDRTIEFIDGSDTVLASVAMMATTTDPDSPADATAVRVMATTAVYWPMEARETVTKFRLNVVV